METKCDKPTRTQCFYSITVNSQGPQIFMVFECLKFRLEVLKVFNYKS